MRQKKDTEKAGTQIIGTTEIKQIAFSWTNRHQILDDVHVRKGVDLDWFAEIRVNMAGVGKRGEEK